MQLKSFFKITYFLCRVFLIILVPIFIFNLLYHCAYLFFQDTGFAASFGEFEPVFSLMIIEFESHPNLYDTNEMLILSFISSTAVFLLCFIVLRLLDKLFQNIYRESLFVKKNVNLFYGLGITILILGTSFFYLDGLIFNKVIQELEISNATIEFSNTNYIDSLFTGIVFILIGAALKVAVIAVEENKYTI